MGGGRKRRKHITSDGAWQPPVEAVSRIVALHPSGTYAVVAVGEKLRGYNARTQETFDVSHDSKAIARVATFSSCGRWLLVGGDDKSFKIWKVDCWDACVNTFKTQKKVSAAAFTPDGNHCIAADKFGDVYCGTIDVDNPTPPLSLLLGHYCSIVTSISVPNDGRTIVTTDRDNKVRVSVWPDEPANGAFEIQSFCMGHSSFVTSSCFAHWAGNDNVLVTAGGDGKIMLWNHTEGKLLGTFQVPPSPKSEELEEGTAEDSIEKADGGEGAPSGNLEDGDRGAVEGEVDATGETDSESNESEKDDEGGMGGPSHPSGKTQSTSMGNVVVCVAAATDRPYLAVAVEGCDEVLILECDASNWKVSLKQNIPFADVSNPCFVNFDKDGKLWVAGGPVVTESNEIHLGLAEMDGSGHFSSSIKERIPSEALAFLECRSKGSSEDTVGAKAASLSQTLGKKGYKEVDFRKRYRADHREREILKQRAEAKLNGSKEGT